MKLLADMLTLLFVVTMYLGVIGTNVHFPSFTRP